jgi:hypothetical protein
MTFNALCSMLLNIYGEEVFRLNSPKSEDFRLNSAKSQYKFDR